MDEFLGSLDFNQAGDLLISSSYLTFQYWTGFIGVLGNNELDSRLEANKPLMLSSLNVNKNFNIGICSAKWCLNNKVLVGTERGDLMLFSLNLDSNENKFENLMSKLEHDSLILCLACKEGSEFALSGSQDTRIKIWDLNENLSIRTFKAHDHSVCSLTLKPNDNKSFISTSLDNRVLLWDTRKEKPAFLIRHGLSGYASSSAWSEHDQNLLALGSETGELGIYDLRMINKKELTLSKIHDRLIRQVKFSNSSNLVSTASEDCLTKSFQLVKASVLTEPGVENIYKFKHQDYVTDLTWNPNDSTQYLTCSWDGHIKRNVVNLKIQNGH